MVKLKEIVDRIGTIAPTISSGPLSGALHAPEISASPTECFSNAQRKAQRAGGGVLYGWMFHYRVVAVMTTPGYLIAVNHAVWHAPDKRLIDTTPFHSDPKHRPIVVNGNAVLFLIDNSAPPLTSGQGGLALPSWFFLTDDKAMTAHVAKLTADELDGWEKQVAGNEALSGSQRASTLLLSRRK